MSHLFKAANIAQEMIDKRDTMRKLYGPMYSRHALPARRALLSHIEKTGKSIMPAALELCKHFDTEGMPLAMAWTIAAAVDLCEESEAAK